MNANSRKNWNAGLNIDGIANAVVLGAGLVVVLFAAASAGPESDVPAQQAIRPHVTAWVAMDSIKVGDIARGDTDSPPPAS